MQTLGDVSMQVLVEMHGLESAGSISTISDLRNGAGGDSTDVIVADLCSQGLVRKGDRLVADYYLTQSGIAEVEALTARQADRGRRRVECRAGLLRWVDGATTPDPGTRVSRDGFVGTLDLVPYAADEVASAAQYLHDHDLVSSVSAWGDKHFLLWITERGRDCIDSGLTIADFVSPSAAAGHQAITISGSGNVVAAAAGSGNTASAASHEFDPEAARTFAALVREAMPALQLNEDLTDLLAEIEQVEDQTLARKATVAVYQLLSSTTSGAIGGLVAAAGAQALGITA